MKKIIYLAFCLMCFTACENTQKQQSDNTESRDSLQRVIEQKNNEINDMLGTLNEIQEGFRQISIAEDRVTVIKDGEATSRKEQIRSDIEFIAQQMQHNRELIAKLQKQAREGSIAAEQLKKTIENLTAQLEEKNKQLETLRTELHAKDLRIEVLDLAVSSLNNDVEELRAI